MALLGFADKLSGYSDDPTDVIEREFKTPEDLKWKEMIDNVISHGFFVSSDRNLEDNRERDCRCFYDPAWKIDTSSITLPSKEKVFFDVREVKEYPSRDSLFNFLNSIPEDVQRPKGYTKRLELEVGPKFHWSEFIVTRHKNNRVTVKMTQIVRPWPCFTNDFRKLFSLKRVYFSKTIEKVYVIKGLSESERAELFQKDRNGIGEWYGGLPDFNALIATKQVVMGE